MTSKMYEINNVDIELFTIGELAKRLDRQRQTLRKWEKNGVIPEAIYRSGSNRRLYSHNQIEAIVQTVNEFKLTQGLLIPAEFKDIVYKRFKEATEMDFQQEEPINS